VPPTETPALVARNTDFALRLYAALRRETPSGNLFYSPYSISVALAMTWAGARADTESQMARAATAVGVAPPSIPMTVDVTIDRPFLLFVRDRPTGAILFAGRVVDPR
jgi:serine protease inhibitor